jgi:hypothetical protein
VSHTEAPISITVKTAAGSLVTVRANDGTELDNIVAQGLNAITSATTELEKAIRGAIPTPMTVGQVASALGASIKPINNSTTTLGGRNCPHGRMTAIQGPDTKNNSIYRGYFCSAPKGAFDKCKNVYLKITDPEWNTFVPDQVK